MRSQLIFSTVYFFKGAGIITRRPLILQLIHVPKRNPENSDNLDELQERDAYFDASPISSGIL